MSTITCSECRIHFSKPADLAWHIENTDGCTNAYRLEKPCLVVVAECYVCAWTVRDIPSMAFKSIRAHFDANPSPTISGRHWSKQHVECDCGWQGLVCSTRSDVEASLSYHRAMHKASL